MGSLPYLLRPAACCALPSAGRKCDAREHLAVCETRVAGVMHARHRRREQSQEDRAIARLIVAAVPVLLGHDSCQRRRC